MPQVDEEEIRVDAIDTVAQPRTLTGVVRSAVGQTNLLPVLLVLTAMMVALWLMGMPFVQALTISTALKISMVLFAARRLPCASKG
ncbi:hypothetical protein [Streptomyces sp. V3I7]|uniref:hypothetical protein n=1 Tax=Streptomyces sp. V3I7 TaxID=3042278 RepID=UPI0027890FD6|nr:hypothetical protein [Streptomyces sp. V3I7]MDQ0994451.1 Na+/H+ antiporter NhaC [Streptomyces sp. V3I7]